ncbi:hypothetical protein AYO21_09695 [Fonsecaea monophora]|uniref:Uncharacterized protein n=1 Tax=Fonsecaea monophora TaxID=254056 RepID=A0A177EVU3_9EURO|nr:hypothetical protein AYO21_09695 [Fonsecaea monophora]KAH0835127.1 putative peroxisomal membrane protein 2, pxmp2 [Fonsecaea pedrosoi]OAG36068.1 hypothetical protein AYO21_09695 [Fonsecaea monophora]
MPSILSVTIQSAILKAAANFTAQTLTLWNVQSLDSVNWTRVVEFAIFGIVSAPLASVWQQFLEDSFPSVTNVSLAHPDSDLFNDSSEEPVAAEEKAKSTAELNWRNTLTKLILDQTVGQFVINLTFLICTNISQLQSWHSLLEEVQTRIFSIIWASWKVWPWVALINFIWVPVQWRVTVTSLVGFCWNVFLSTWSMHDKP